MVTVPYNPVPQEVTGGQLGEVNVRVSEASFGGDLARAISGLGKTVEGVGDQIAERAIWLQNLNNQAEARKADATYIIESGKLHAEFNSLEGDQALKAYPQYQEKLKALRSQIRSGLSNQATQVLYDGQTLGTLSRAIFNGASHVAAAQKKFVTDSAEAQLTAIREQAAANPFDQGLTDSAIRRTEATVRQMGKLRGQPPEAIDNNVKIYQSAIYASQIENTAKEYPLRGPTMFATMRDKLTQADAKRVETIVNNQRDAYGSAKIAQDLLKENTDDDGDLKISMAELQAKAKALAEKFSPDDPAFATKTVRALQGEFNQTKYARKQENYDNRDIVNGTILKGVKNLDELLTDPKANKAYYALPEKERLQVPGRIYNYIRSRDRDFNEHTMTTIMGLRANDVEAFLNIEPTDEKYKLSQAQIREVQASQEKIKRYTTNDPRVGRAMTWLKQGFGAQMTALGVRDRTKANTDEYDHLTGAVQQALDIWQEQNKKPPTQQEFNEKIAPNVLRQTQESWSSFLNRDDRGMFDLFPSKRTLFQHDTNSREYKAFVEAAREEIKRRGQPDPHDEELYKAYTRLQLLKLYPPKGKSSE